MSEASQKQKITIRTLKQEEYHFECEPTDTILSLKEQIHARLQHETDWQTLIYSGVVLPNDRTIESCKILDKGFMVLMVKKPRVVAPAPAPTPAAQPQAPVEQKTPAAPSTPAKSAESTTATPPGAPEEMIGRLMELGFGRSDVVRALEICANNPDRAVELLMMGDIPLGAPSIPSGQQAPAVGQTPAQGHGISPFQAIKDTPQFQQLRILAQQSPQLFEQVLQQLPPEVIQLINNNQEEFIRLLQEQPVIPPGGFQQPGGGTPGQRAGGLPPGTIQLRVTPEDEAIINNLVAMTGVTKDQVVRAYALFEKDAEMTANYLLNHGHEDDAMGGFGGNL